MPRVHVLRGKAIGEHSRKVTIYRARNRGLPRNKSADTLILNFHPWEL
jgi:hypothetical protein